jgi:uncharacterized phiE125 gp8 family phage protein
MSERLIAPPAALALSLDAARRAARASGTALDAELTDKVQGITEDAEHITGRAFITQTWELALNGFPDAIRLPHPPVASVVHVKYYDAAGVQQTLDPLDYLVDAKSEPGWILPAPGKAWPSTAARVDAVEVRYVCGYGPDWASVPAAIRDFIAGMLENHYYPNPNAEFLSRKLDRYWVPG